MPIKRLALALLAAWLWPFASAAETAPIGMVTGPQAGTYFAIASDVAKLSHGTNAQLLVKPSQGSLDNIKRINSTENAVLGIVQSDVMGYLNRAKDKASFKMVGPLRVVFPLYQEEVHVLARRSINSFAELTGKKVAIGENGSGSMITALNLFSLLDVKPAESKKMASASGVLAVLKGELDAVIFVGGKPVRLFKNLEELAMPENIQYAAMLDQVHFLNLTDPNLMSEYKPATLSRDDYVFIEDDVQTVAVTAMLVSYDLSKNLKQPRCKALAALSDLIREKLETLRASGHPKWKEVDLNADIGSWKKDECSW